MRGLPRKKGFELSCLSNFLWGLFECGSNKCQVSGVSVQGKHSWRGLGKLTAQHDGGVLVLHAQQGWQEYKGLVAEQGVVGAWELVCVAAAAGDSSVRDKLVLLTQQGGCI